MMQISIFTHADFLKMDNLSDKKFSVIVSNPRHTSQKLIEWRSA
ncbi:MAG: hypothetical protein R3C26_24115 [Calditrichia bacterium]